MTGDKKIYSYVLKVRTVIGQTGTQGDIRDLEYVTVLKGDVGRSQFYHKENRRSETSDPPMVEHSPSTRDLPRYRLCVLRTITVSAY